MNTTPAPARAYAITKEDGKPQRRSIALLATPDTIPDPANISPPTGPRPEGFTVYLDGELAWRVFGAQSRKMIRKPYRNGTSHIKRAGIQELTRVRAHDLSELRPEDCPLDWGRLPAGADGFWIGRGSPNGLFGGDGSQPDSGREAVYKDQPVDELWSGASENWRQLSETPDRFALLFGPAFETTAVQPTKAPSGLLVEG